jgi:hypothetical protein
MTSSLLKTRSMLGIVVVVNCGNSDAGVVDRGLDGWAADVVVEPKLQPYHVPPRTQPRATQSPCMEGLCASVA